MTFASFEERLVWTDIHTCRTVKRLLTSRAKYGDEDAEKMLQDLAVLREASQDEVEFYRGQSYQ